MIRSVRISAIALAVSAGWALPAQAQTADNAAIQQELAAMRAQIDKLANRVDTLQGQLEQEKTRADAADARAAAAASAPAAVAASAPAQAAADKSAPTITWDGAPKIATEDGWSFKPRGRLQIDVAGVDAPSGLASTIPGTSFSNADLGYGAEFRRAYIGFDGTMPGGFGYRVEADLASSSVNLTDVYLNYKASKDITLTVGQHKPFWGLEEMTSDLFTSFMERAAFSSGFGFERRLGASAAYLNKSLLVQGGVFADNVADLNNDKNNSYSFDGRVVFMPTIGDGQLHIGGSVHFRDFNDQSGTTRYRARPFVHTTDATLVDTGNITATGENSMGMELAYINGRIHATTENYWITALRPGLKNPTFGGGYVEVGYLLTDDKTAYKGGVYDRIRPKNPVSAGGIGAIQVNGRFDWLDLNDAGVIGGRQEIAGASVLWIPMDYVRFILNYGHLWIKDSPVTADGDPNYQADSLGVRAQFDF
jgi:phosphate-selective porin OprO/OprP